MRCPALHLLRGGRRGSAPDFARRAVRRLGFAGALLLALALGRAPAADLVVAKVDDAARATLPGHRAAWATAENDRGAVPDDLALTHLSLALKRPPERQQAFEQLLREQQDPASPNYHRWLSPSEIGARFGATQHDVDAITGWLRSRGLAVDAVANNRLRIRFSGRAADVGAAFATGLHYFADVAAPGERVANTADPAIPAALAPSVRAVLGLSAAHFRPMHHVGARWTAPAAASAASPQLTICSTTPCSHFVTPADFATIYGLSSVPAGVDGSGQTIAIVGRERVYAADIQNFEARTGLPTRQPSVVVPPDGTDPGQPATSCSDTGTPSCSDPSDEVLDQSEATLDVERAVSVAPGAAVQLIVSGNRGQSDGVGIAIEYAIDTEPVPAQILSISFGSCEADNTQSDAESIDEFFAQAAAEGISVFVSSGDGGVAGCAALDSPPQTGEAKTTNIFCSSGHVTCVGGTQFADTANPSLYWSSTNSSAYGSALGYIPEGAWNEPTDDSGATQVAASGGGVSAYIAKPSWQIGTGVPGNQGRYTPDVSFNAAVGEGYLMCFAAQGGPCTIANNSFKFLSTGGTSASTPSMAGVAALLNQHLGTAQGNLNPRLYALAGDTGNGVFHDVTVATSGVTNCSLSVPSLCNNSTPGPNGLSGGLQGYAVGPGYDPVTGLGSIHVGNLLAHWNDAAAATVNQDQFGLTGTWGNDEGSNEGLVMTVYPDLAGANRGVLFAGWFTYDVTAAGGQRWYTVQGDVDAGAASTTLPIYRTVGGRFDSSQAITQTQVGQATIAFSDCGHGTLYYAFSDGSNRSGSLPMARITQNVNCTAAGDGDTAMSGYLLSGAWADLGDAGQGIVFEINPVQGALFGAWYTYAANASAGGGASQQRWFTLQTSFTSDPRSWNDIVIYNTTGGVFDSLATTATTPVGDASLTMTSCDSATLTYRFSAGENAGRSGTLDLTRVGPAPPGCSF